MEARDLLLDSWMSLNGRNSTEDEDRHLKQCWIIGSCDACIRSRHVCAWCPSSSSCVPLPYGGNILSPIHDAHMCPMQDERWELRTKAFGCNCSTTTFLAVLISILSTIGALIFLWILWKLIRAIWLSMRAPRGGWKIEFIEEVDGEHWKQGIWVRKRPNIFARIKNGWKRMNQSEAEAGNDPDVLVVDENGPLLR